MNQPLITALRILGHFWLEEVRPADVDTLAALPELAQSLPDFEPATLDLLAVEYQRLFGFNLPPYESVFIDPTIMLMAPATERIQRLYQQGGWSPPAGSRAGAPDHLGLELLALADWQAAGQTELARQLHTAHLALWLPPFALALQRLKPHPFYAALADLSLDLILATLPPQPLAELDDPFPVLPPPPVYTASLGPDSPAAESPETLSLPGAPEPAPPSPLDLRLRDVIKRLLPPCEVGLYITREDIARIGRALESPGAMGERQRMLDSIFRFAGQYDLVERVFEYLGGLLDEAGADYGRLAAEYPAWQSYAKAWQRRLDQTKAELEALKALAGQ